MKGKKHSTATVLINEDADKIYNVVLATIKRRGYTKIEKQDPKKRISKVSEMTGTPR